MSTPWQTNMLLARLVFLIAVVAVLYGADVLQRRAYAEYQDTCMLFYADWCGHCKSFMPQWTRFESAAPRSLQGTRTLALGSSSGNAAGALFGVSSFPTIIYVDRMCRRHDYTGPRTSESLTAFVSNLR